MKAKDIKVGKVYKVKVMGFDCNVVVKKELGCGLFTEEYICKDSRGESLTIGKHDFINEIKFKAQ